MQLEQRNRWWLVAAMGLVLFMATLDMNIVTVALPSVEEDFGTSTSLTEWVVLAYMLPMIALVLPAGRWLDGVGKRAALLFAVAGFGVSSALAGAAGGIVWLIASRFLQGSFAALMLAQVPVLATQAVRPEARGRAMGIVTTVSPMGAVCGPAVGGFLVGTLGWPFIFYVNIPVTLAVLVVVTRTMTGDGGLRVPERAARSEAAVLGGATAAVLLALSLAPARGPVWLALALPAVPLLLVWRRMPQSRIITGLVGRRGMPGPHLALLLTPTAVLMVQFLAPFYLRDVVGVSAATTGLTVLMAPLFMAALGIGAGALADRYGARLVAAAGAGTMVAALALLAPLPAAWDPIDLGWRLALLGTGMGLFAGPVNALAMARSPRELLGTTGASTNLARNAGFTLGPALATAVWALFGYTLAGMRAGTAVAAGLTLLAAGAIATSRGAPVDVSEEAATDTGTAPVARQ